MRAIGPVSFYFETPNDGLRRRQAEDRAMVATAAVVGCAVELSIGSLDQSRDWVGAVGAMSLRTEAVKRGHCSSRRDLEDRALVISAARLSCPVKIAIGSLDKRSCGTGAIRLVEDVQQRKRATRSDVEECAGVEAIVGSAGRRYPYRFPSLPSTSVACG